MAQFPPEVFDSPRPRRVRCVSCTETTTGDFDANADAEAEAEAGDAPSVLSSLTPFGTVEAPEKMLALSTTGASVEDESAAADGSTRAARLDMLSAAVRKLRMLFDCSDCGDCDNELMLEIDSGRSLSLNVFVSLWRVRMRDSFRLITLPSGSRDLLSC
jgi:hypothetical protein